MFLLPFQVTVFGVTIPIPDWSKATLGLALPVMANVSEILRGAMQSIPTAQWESAASLAFSRRQTLWMIILPQCVKRMLPPWMNLYAILSMDVPKGGVLCIIGPSGSGKSTLLRCINALVPIDSGSIRVADFEVHLLTTDKERLALRREVSIVFQQYNLFPHKTALENVMMAPVYVLREPRDEVRERAIALLKKVGLAAKPVSYTHLT